LVFYDKCKDADSLLNTDADGSYKFIHKSIFEYLLAKQIFNNHHKYNSFGFTGMGVVDICCKEMFLNQLKQKKVKYKATNNNVKTKLNDINISDLANATYLKLEIDESINPTHFKYFTNL